MFTIFLLSRKGQRDAKVTKLLDCQLASCSVGDENSHEHIQLLALELHIANEPQATY